MSLNANTRDNVLLLVLIGAVSALAVGMVWIGQATRLEACSFVTGAVCVWLVVKQSIWNFPVGLVNVATYCVVFYDSKLFGDAALQVVYFVLGLSGWYLWFRADELRSRLRVVRASPVETGVLLLLVAGGTVGLWQTLHRVGGSASLWDALTTCISLASQWLLNRKRLENWIGWIIVDIIYVPLYAYKELYLTAILYAIFLVMAIIGLHEWRQSWLRDRGAASTDSPLVGEAT